MAKRAATRAKLSPTRDVIGYVEEVVEALGTHVLKGWAFDRTDPERPVVLTISFDGRAVGEAICDEPRADLEAAGLSRTDCGFLWPVRPGAADGAPQMLEVSAPHAQPLSHLLTPSQFALLWQPPPSRHPPRSPLFDEAFYQSQAHDLGPDVDPWAHFLDHGAAGGLNPNPLFDVASYLAHSPDVPDSGENALLHFERVGRAARRSHHWLFDGPTYLRLNPDLPPGTDPLHHALRHGLRENRWVSPLLDAGYYLARYPDVAASKVPALLHFLADGDREGRAPHPLFDPAYYRAQIPASRGRGALQHHVESGGSGAPHPLFDPSYYRQCHAAAQDGTIPLLHYLETGAARSFDPCAAFDTAYYLRQSPEPDAARNPLRHYVTEGRARGRSPHPLFDPGFYASQPPRRATNGQPLPITGPTISVVVPVHNTPPDVLAQCLDSVLAQTYTAWELCIVDDASRNAATIAVLARYRSRDPRIRIDRSVANLHIAGATNRAVMHATGAFIAFLDHDDVLEPDALAEVATAVLADPTIDLLYSDEDKLDENGHRTEPYHKPAWSPEHLNSVMYLLHMLVVRKSLFWAVGGSRPERTGAQDYDLALRAAARARRVHHVPKILYHWRMMQGSAAGDAEAKPYALAAARAALEDAIAAQGLEADVEDGLVRGTFRVRARLAPPPLVSLMVLTHDIEREIEGRGRINLVRNFMRSLAEKSTYGNTRLFIIDDANSSAETRKLAKEIGARIVPYRSPGPFNYARKANFATRTATSEHIIYLNDDMEVIEPGWIEALLEQTIQEKVGGAGARLLYPDGRIQHAGVVLGVSGATSHAFLGLGRDVIGYNAYTHLIRNYSAVTGAVFATRRAVMEEVGGFDERLAIDYNDIDLCLRICRTGRRIVYTPYSELYHFEGSSAVRTDQNPTERDLFTARWAHVIANDPYYNPNLPRDPLGIA